MCIQIGIQIFLHSIRILCILENGKIYKNAKPSLDARGKNICNSKNAYIEFCGLNSWRNKQV